MKKFYLFIFALFILAFGVSDAKDYFTPYNDLALNYEGEGSIAYMYEDEESGIIHFITAGYDANQNGIKDEGDASPEWWTFTGEPGFFNTQKRHTFDFGSVKSITRAAIDENEGILYMPLKGRIASYNLETFEVIKDTILAIDAVSLDFELSTLLITETDLEGHSRVRIFDIANDQLLFTEQVGMNVSQLIAFVNGSKFKIAAATHAGEGAPALVTGTLDLITQSFITETINYDHEITGLETGNGMLIVSSIPGHIIDVYNTADMSLKFSIDTKITGDLGPKQVKYDITTDEIIFINENVVHADTTGTIKAMNVSTLNDLGIMEFLGEDLLILERTKKFLIYKRNEGPWTKNRIDVEVGKQPAIIHMMEDNQDKQFHVICLGADINYNGVFEPEMGDEKPSWWVISGGDYEPQKAMEFEFGSFVDPLYIRTALDKQAEKLYIPFKGKISVFDANTFELLEDEFLDISASGVHVNETMGLIASIVPEGPDSKGTMMIHDLETKQLKYSMETEVNPIEVALQQIMPDNIIDFAVLSEGFYGDTVSYVQQGSLENFQATSMETFEAGPTANNLFAEGPFLYIADNGGHSITMINRNNGSLEQFPTGTTGWNGPRFVAKTEDWFFVTTYSGDIRQYEDPWESSEIDDIIHTPGKAEGIAAKMFDGGEYIIAACIISDEFYSPMNIVSIWTSLPVSVEQDDPPLQDALAKIYPNPLNQDDIMHISIKDICSCEKELEIEIYNINGISLGKFKERVRPDGTLEYQKALKDLDLSTGAYYLRYINGKEIRSIPFRVAD